MTGIWIILALIVVLNLYGFFMMGYDKRQAKHHRERVPEKKLFTIAFLGCGPGAYYGMLRFRHKTKHLSFRILFPIAALWCVALYVVVLRLVWMVL